MVPRAALQRGLSFPPPMVLADLLEQRLGHVSARAQQLALEILVPAIASGDDLRIQEALTEIEARLEAEANEREIEAAAKDVAARASDMHRKVFFAALGAAIGMRVLGSDEVEAAVEPAGAQTPFPMPSPGLPGASLDPRQPGGIIAQAAQLAAKPRNRRGVLVAKLSAEPRLLSEQFARKNAMLIKSLRREVVPALRDEVVRAVQFGYSAEEAAERLAKKWEKSGVPVTRGNLRARVGVVVRDQVAKLNTDLTKARQQAAGIEKFRWMSQKDSRVRPLHRAIHGKIYTWAHGHPTEGLPGEPVLCRCYAEAVIDRDAVVNARGFIHLATSKSDFEVAA